MGEYRIPKTSLLSIGVSGCNPVGSSSHSYGCHTKTVVLWFSLMINVVTTRLSAPWGSWEVPTREAPRGRRTIKRDSVMSACTTNPGMPTTTGCPAAKSVASTLRVSTAWGTRQFQFS